MSRLLHTDAIDRFLTRLDGADTEEACRAVFLAAVQNVGYSGFNYAAGMAVPGSVRRGRPDFLRPPRCITTWSLDWIQHYQRANFYTVDPVFKASLESVVPVDWGQFARGRKDDTLKQFFGHASSFSLANGFTIPVHGADGEFGVISVTSDAGDRAFTKVLAETRHVLHVMAIHFHEAVRRRLDGFKPPAEKAGLTPRELEILFWAAKGKTLSEIADITSRSESTVRFHLRQVTQKLGVSTRTQAIVRSVQHGLLHL